MKNQKIRTVSYKVWQVFDFLILKILKFIIIKMFQERIDADFLEFNFDSYKNFWFLIDKKVKNKYQMINAIMNINEIIIRDINLSFNVKKFLKEFINMLIILLINFFSDYDQITLAEKCRNLIIFMTSFKFLKMIKLSQKIINSIIQFVKMIIKILWKHIIAFRCWLFVDDINIDDSRSNYDNKEILFEMRLYILKHIQWLNAILMNLKKTDCTISNEKFQFYVVDFKIVDFICDSNDRFFETIKMIKILKWFSCRDISEIRAFIEVCVYYKI